MGIADVYLAEVGSPADEWERETATEAVKSLRDVPALVGDEELLHYAARPVVTFMIRFAADLWPGTDCADDAEWAATVALARRETAVQCQAGIDTRLSDLNLAVLDWVEARIDSWDDQAFASLVRARVDGLLETGRRGRERGSQLREARQPRSPAAVDNAGWLLRHPGDHYFRSARASASDDRLCELLDAQITLLAASYDRLAAGHDAYDQAEVIAELGVLAPVGRGWREPVAATVLAAEKGAISVGDRLGLRLVADPAAATFNGALVSVRAGERWLTYAHRLEDGTIVPDDGTRRTAA